MGKLTYYKNNSPSYKTNHNNINQYQYEYDDKYDDKYEYEY